MCGQCVRLIRLPNKSGNSNFLYFLFILNSCFVFSCKLSRLHIHVLTDQHTDNKWACELVGSVLKVCKVNIPFFKNLDKLYRWHHISTACVVFKCSLACWNMSDNNFYSDKHTRFVGANSLTGQRLSTKLLSRQVVAASFASRLTSLPGACSWTLCWWLYQLVHVKNDHNTEYRYYTCTIVCNYTWKRNHRRGYFAG